MSSITRKNAPIGVFDSGFGGLTVAKALREMLPHEDIVFFGDSGRCPYGPREPEEVEKFSLQICNWLVGLGCKLIVIACNTATAAALATCQMAVDVPVMGVIQPGARAAVEATRSRKVGVIGTVGTITSGAYLKAIRYLDCGIQVVSLPTPNLVQLVEDELIQEYIEALDVRQARVMDELAPLLGGNIDTLVLGCTHYPLLYNEIKACFTEDVRLVNSSEETAHDVFETLDRRDEFSESREPGHLRFVTSGVDTELRNRIASRIMGFEITDVEFKSFDEE